MPLIAQICMVVVTIALVGIAVISVRLVLQTKALIETANRSLAELPALIKEAKETSARADDLLIALTNITRSVHAGATQFEGIATRTGSLAARILEEVEHPVSRAVGVMRGIRAGANHLFQRWQSHAGSRSPSNQGDDHVGEQRWLDDGGIPAGSGRRGGAGPDFRANGR
jgi:uncharacterized membrane protein (Fun14 family)